MFDVSFTELMVIGVIALIVIGPQRLPKVARTVGHLLGRAQRYVNDVKADIQRELELDELRKFKSDMENAAQSVQTSMRDAESSLREPAQALRQELDEAAKAATSAVSLHGEPPAATEAKTTSTQAASTETTPAQIAQAGGGASAAMPAGVVTHAAAGPAGTGSDSSAGQHTLAPAPAASSTTTPAAAPFTATPAVSPAVVPPATPPTTAVSPAASGDAKPKPSTPTGSAT